MLAYQQSPQPIFALLLKKVHYILATLSLLSLMCISACNDFEKIQKSKDFEYKRLKADEYYSKKKWSEANLLYEELVPLYKGRKEFEELYYRYANTFYMQGNYLASSYHFKNFTEVFPNSPRREECEYYSALSLYKDSPEASLDQNSTIRAVAALQDYVNRHPDSPLTQEANKMIDEARQKLESKDAASAELYFKISEYKSAAVAFAQLLKKYPESAKADYYQYKILLSNYEYARLSIASKQEERFAQALVDYADLITNYPNTKYKAEADQLKNTIFALQKKLKP